MVSVKNTIDRLGLIKKHDIIGCAVSGGSDSMSLLHFLLSLQQKYCFSLICLNVEHGIRGEQSKADTLFVKEYCNRNGIKFYGKELNVLEYCRNKSINLEQAARQLRYDFFYGAIKKKLCNKVFTAHNKNDNVETVLLNILRGSGGRGLCGMSPVNGRGIVRPMLYTGKSEIDEYVKLHNIKYRTDNTNFDNSYSRNYIRNTVLPLIEQKFGGVYDNITRLSGIMTEECNFLEELSRKNIDFTEKGCYINLPMHSVLLKHAIMICCRELGIYTDVTSTNVEDIAQLAYRQSGKYVTAGGGIKAHKDYNKLFIEFNSSNRYVITKIPFDIGSFILGGFEIEICHSDREEFNKGTENALFADYDKIKNSVIRFRKHGDSFKRYKGGTKSLSDYLTDIKIPKRERDEIPLICRGSQVLAVLPCDISDDVKIDGGSRSIIKLKYRRIKQ